MKSEQDANRVIELYADTIRRICMTYLKSYSDTEDIFQNVFTKYILYPKDFENVEHEKAWFIRVTINECKDFLKSFFRSRTVPLEEAVNQMTFLKNENQEVLKAVMTLPEKYRVVVYLHYYEGYSAVEIGKILNKNTNTIYTYLARARMQLKDLLGGVDFE